MLPIHARTIRGQEVKKHAVGWIKGLLKYGIGFGLLAYVLSQNWEPKGNNPGIKGLLAQAPDGVAVATLVALAVTCTSIQFVRWYLLVRALDLPFTIGTAFRLGLVGSFYNAFLPGSVGGDLVKAYYIAHGQPGRRASAVATVIADRLVGLFGLIWFSAVFGGAFWLAGDVRISGNDYLKGIVRVCSGLVAATVIGWGILGLLPPRRADRFAERLTAFPTRLLAIVVWIIRRILPQRWADRFTQRLTGLSKKVGDSLAEGWYAVWTYRQRPKVVYTTIAMTAVVHIGFVTMFHLAVRVFPAVDPASFPEHLVVTPIGYIAQAFFPAPGGVGGGEAIFGYLYTLLGRPESTGVVGRLTLRINEWAIGIVGLFVFLRMRNELRVEDEETEDKSQKTEDKNQKSDDSRKPDSEYQTESGA
ncbi:MAG TPA: lysylphosphatidylglycerol synthase transmembrane domain-containing protein [Gemmata sp.]|jgi:hypothetical protein|nr:lysylphosphatidylglycerol synthase transmembrane domain-containing protein [Gemmata sp.]